MRYSVLMLCAAASIAAPATASAATTIDGTFSAAMFGVASSTQIIDAGSVLSYAFTLVTSSAGEMGGDVPPVPSGEFITLSSLTATVNTSVSFSSAFGSYIGTIQRVTVDGPSSNRTLGLVALGTFTPAGTLSSYAPGAASLTFSFTQTGGANGAKSGSFTFASPPTGVPEPMSWALMVTGAGFAGAAARRYRRKSDVAIA